MICNGELVMGKRCIPMISETMDLKFFIRGNNMRVELLLDGESWKEFWVIFYMNIKASNPSVVYN